MTAIYLAARYSRRLELCAYADELRDAGHTITSRWLAGGHQAPDQGPDPALGVFALAERRRFAEEDWADLMAADWFVAFTEPVRSGPSRGGRHVELGAALAVGKRVVIVGYRENVFTCLNQVEFHETWESARDALIGGGA